MLDSPSEHFFPILHRISIDFTLTNRTWKINKNNFSMRKSTEPTFTGRNGAGRLLPSCFKRRSLGPAAVAQPSDTGGGSGRGSGTGTNTSASANAIASASASASASAINIAIDVTCYCC